MSHIHNTPKFPDDHLLKQIFSGEFGIYEDEAKTLTAEEFASKYSSTVRLRGLKAEYKAVRIDCTDYLWIADSGKYDGWDRQLKKQI